MQALSIAATGMLAREMEVSVISNNLANMRTTAFNRQRAEFQDLFYQDIQNPGAQSSGSQVISKGIQIGLGTKLTDIYRITEQGALTSTQRPFDLAITGAGYFQFTKSDGTLVYTRDGARGFHDREER